MDEDQTADFLAALGHEVATWRRRKGLTRQALAEQVGISETTLGRIERGGVEGSVATADVWRIADALGLTFSGLIARAEDAVRLAMPLASHGTAHALHTWANQLLMETGGNYADAHKLALVYAKDRDLDSQFVVDLLDLLSRYELERTSGPVSYSPAARRGTPSSRIAGSPQRRQDTVETGSQDPGGMDPA